MALVIKAHEPAGKFLKYLDADTGSGLGSQWEEHEERHERATVRAKVSSSREEAADARPINHTARKLKGAELEPANRAVADEIKRQLNGG